MRNIYEKLIVWVDPSFYIFQVFQSFFIIKIDWYNLFQFNLICFSQNEVLFTLFGVRSVEKRGQLQVG